MNTDEKVYPQHKGKQKEEGVVKKYKVSMTYCNNFDEKKKK